jgi:SMI1 / KNR4 family (SUKH-1)
MLHTQFAVRFAVDRLHGPARPCAVSELDQVEEKLNTNLPIAYRDFMSANGPLFVPLLSEIAVFLELGIETVHEFFSPVDVTRNSQMYWSAGMPADFIGVASDVCGNMFGFQRLERGGLRPDDSPVLFFDHDFVQVLKRSESFDAWLESFLARVPLAKTD